jgi:hypothetical protein
LKIDVVCVTKTAPSKAWLKNLDYIPVNNLIIETSTPLSIARKNAIAKVETDWFLFLDDDAFLCADWFQKAQKFMRDDVGAIQGREWIYGLGSPTEKEINNFRWSKPDRELSLGKRGMTVDTLLKTSILRDWNPKGVIAYEDYLLTQHVLRKGFKWLEVRLPCWHMRSWMKNFFGAKRDMQGLKKVMTGRETSIQMVKILGFSALQTVALVCGLKLNEMRLKVYIVHQNLGCVVGLLFG